MRRRPCPDLPAPARAFVPFARAVTPAGLIYGPAGHLQDTE